MNKGLQLAVSVALLAAALPAAAERVYVKSRGEVELAPFRCEGVARGANVKRLCYDERERYLLVSVKGIWYHYCGVSPATLSAWRRASAPGRYYNDNVRSNYECSGTSAPAYR